MEVIVTGELWKHAGGLDDVEVEMLQEEDSHNLIVASLQPFNKGQG